MTAASGNGTISKGEGAFPEFFLVLHAMLSLSLPNLLPGFLEDVMVCGRANADHGWPDDVTFVQAEYPVDGGKHWLLLGLNRTDASGGYIHLEVGTADDDFEVPKIEIPNLFAMLDPFVGCVVEGIQIDADFCVPFGKLPRRGMIQTVLGMPTALGGYELFLTGATMAIEGDTFRELTWKAHAFKDAVAGSLRAGATRKIDEQYLSNAVQMMNEGVDIFVLERKDDQQKHAHIKTVANAPVVGTPLRQAEGG